MKADFKAVAGRIVKAKDWVAKYRALVKSKLTLVEKFEKALLLNPACVVALGLEFLRLRYSESALEGYRDPVGEFAIYEDTSGEMYMSASGFRHILENMEQHHPILAGVGSKKLKDKMEVLVVDALKQSTDYAGKPGLTGGF